MNIDIETFPRVQASRVAVGGGLLTVASLGLSLCCGVLACVTVGLCAVPDARAADESTPVGAEPAAAVLPDGLPFSELRRAAGLLFLSGQLGTKPGTTELVAGGIGPETRQAMQNIAAVLERNGASMKDVVKCTVMLADIDEWAAMNEVYVEFFPEQKPARSAFAASGLGFGGRLEIECIATDPQAGG